MPALASASAPSSADVVVIGGGAAGLMAAIFAGRAGARTVLLEKTKRGGKKIVVSGGGRCNVLPSVLDERTFVTGSSERLMHRMLASWPLPDQRRFFEADLGIPLALEAETGKLFPASNRATDVRDALVDAARAVAELRFEADVSALQPRADGWRVGLRDGTALATRAVVIATGGLSVPKTGSDGLGLRVAETLGHRVEPTYPALAPLLADPAPHVDLAGVAVPEAHVEVPDGKRPFRTSGGFLFTHRGYSGPAVLNVSHLTALGAAAGDRPPVRVAWTPDAPADWDSALTAPGRGLVASTLRERLPTRLAERLLADAAVPPDRARADLRREERQRLVAALTAYEIPWTGDEGYKKAEVTGGGVNLGEVRLQTLESRHHAGLHFAGEVLDAFGPIGGYNFFWAWATGRAAGLGAAEGTFRSPA